MDHGLFLLGAMAGMVAAGLALLLASRRYPRARPWAVLAGISLAAMPLAVILHNVLSALIRGEEAISFVVAVILAPAGFAVGTLGAGVALARDGRAWEVGASLTIAGAGMALFGLYGVFALIVTSVGGANPPYQAGVEAIVLPVSLLAIVGGALSALFCSLVPGRQTLA